MSGASNSAPPRFARRVLGRALPPGDRRFALADLDEEFERRAATDRAAAVHWYRAQVVRSLLPALRDRWHRRQRGILATFVEDVRFGLRSILKAPLVSGITVVSLAVGIGATTTAFSAANAFLFKAPSGSIHEPDRLATVFTSDGSGALYGRNSYPDIEDITTQVGAFEQVGAHRFGIVDLQRDGGEAQRVMVEIVSGNYFDVLGVAPVYGRGFRPEETRFGAAEHVMVISHRLWERFDSDPDIVGKTVTATNGSYTIIGVAPADLTSRFLALRVDAWMPIGVPGGTFLSTERELANRSDRDYGVVARLRPGASFEQAQAQLDVAAARLIAEHSRDWTDSNDRPRRFTVLDEKAARVPPDFVAALGGLSGMLMFSTLLVLAIACFNVAGLMLARAEQRQQEVAVRLALGARRRRLVSLLMTESVMLALAAAWPAVVLTRFLLGATDRVSLPIANFSLEFDFAVDSAALVFAVVAALLTSIAFGLVPALRASRPDLVPALRGTSRVASKESRLRRFLVVGQVAAALVFVVGAGISIRSFYEVEALDWGIRTDGMSVMSHDLDANLAPEELVAEYESMIERLAARPEIAGAEIGRVVEGTLFAFDSSAEVLLPGADTDSARRRFSMNAVSPGYFDMLGIRLLDGRAFTDADRADGPRVAVVSESFARMLWPGERVVGKRFRVPARFEAGDGEITLDGLDYEVVGLAADARYNGFENAEEAFFWTPLLQNPASRVMVVARAAEAELALPALRAEMDPSRGGIVLLPPTPLETLLNFQFTFFHVIGRGLAAAGAFGTVLAMMGLYGIVAFMVQRRTREMAIRQAVGALPHQVVRSVFRDGMRLALRGLLLGLVIVVPVAALLRADIAGVSPIEPISTAAGAVVLLLAAAAASYVPAKRATRIDPIESLRSE